jgi:hypothetical protein
MSASYKELLEKKLTELANQLTDESERKSFEAEMEGFKGLVFAWLDKVQKFSIVFQFCF